MHTINPQKLKEELRDCLNAGYPAMIWGGPGIGKSEIPEQVAQEMGVPLIDFRANLFDPVDVRGIPYIKQLKETGKRFTSWAVPDVFPIAERDGERGILFIDELPTAPPAKPQPWVSKEVDPTTPGSVPTGARRGDGDSMLADTTLLGGRALPYSIGGPFLNRACQPST